MNNILVTGGCGFIGSHLVDELILQGHNIFVIDDLSTGVKENCNTRAKYYYFGLGEIINDNSRLSRIIKKNSIKIVYHLAALADVRKTISDPILAYNINSLVTVEVANVCVEQGVEKLVFSSTSAVYGEPIYLPVDEDHPVKPISPYGLSKLVSENYLEYKSYLGELNSYVLRFPNVYGPRQRSDLEGGVIAIFKDRMLENKSVMFFGDGSQTRDWVHCFDLVKAMTSILEIDKKGFTLLSLGSSTKNTLRKLFDLMSSTLNYNKEPVISLQREGDILHMVMCDKRAKELINWQARISLEEGVTKI